jgi:hypothetical protein
MPLRRVPFGAAQSIRRPRPGALPARPAACPRCRGLLVAAGEQEGLRLIFTVLIH